MSSVQSVLFNKKYWSFEKASMKVISMGFKIGQVDIARNLYRFRQISPKKFKYFRIKKITKSIELQILTFPLPHFLIIF